MSDRMRFKNRLQMPESSGPLLNVNQALFALAIETAPPN